MAMALSLTVIVPEMDRELGTVEHYDMGEQRGDNDG
jgi:hypothetical protein